MRSPESRERSGDARFQGLRDAPFSLTPDCHSPFHGGTHADAVAQFEEALARREPLLLIAGEPDVGRTLLCRSPALRRDPRTFVSFVSTPPASPEHLCLEILDEFGVLAPGRSAASGASRFELRHVLRRFLDSLRQLDSRAVIVVDDAQLMPEAGFEELRALSECDGATGRLLQIVLVGEPALYDRLAGSSLQDLAQRITRRSTPGALTAGAEPAYVERPPQIASAGGRPNPPPFTPKAYEAGRLRRQVAVVAAAAILLAASAGGSRLIDRRGAPSPVQARIAAGPATADPATASPLARTAPPPRSSAPDEAVSLAAADAPDSAATGDMFSVVTDSFRTGARAAIAAESVAQLGFPVRVRLASGWHQVIVGPYVTREKAAAARERLVDAHKQESVIVRDRPRRPARIPGPGASTPARPITNDTPVVSDAGLAAGTDREIRAWASALSRVPDVWGLLRLREAIAARPAGTPDQGDPDVLLQEVDGYLDAARRRQLDVDRRLLQQDAGQGKR